MSTDIYQQSIKRLAAEATGHGYLQSCDAKVTLDNAFCGDRVTVEINLLGLRINQVAHNVRGCLLCKAAASVIGTAVQGASLSDIEHTAAQIEQMLSTGVEINWQTQWQALNCFQPVQFHKSRHGCVLLPFEALIQALRDASA